MKYKRMHVKRFCVSILLMPLFFIAELAIADTEVGGNITENMVWTKANSHYIVTSTVQVLEGVKLTTERGVTIKFNQDTELNVGGELIAVGTEVELITFTSNQAEPAPGDWSLKFIDSAIDASFDGGECYLNGSIVKYCRIEFGSGIYCKNCAPYIACNTMTNNFSYSDYGGGIYFYGQTPIRIENNIIENNTAYSKAGGICIHYGTGLINSNTIRNNTAKTDGGGIYNEGDYSIISDNIISNNVAGSDIGHYGGGIYDNSMYTQIRNNLITNNSVWAGGGIFNAGKNNALLNNTIFNNTSDQGGGIYTSRATSIIEENNIENNIGGGIWIHQAQISYSEPFVIQHNNIINNLSFEQGDLLSIHNDTDNEVEAENNYWGTTDTSIIDQQIYDYYDDITKGKVIYEPIAFQPYDFSGGSISGNVANSSTGQPIIGAIISTNIGVQTTTDNSGEYLFENISLGDYTLTVTAPLYHSSTVENVTVTAGETTTQDVSLDPKTTGTVAGQVVSAEGLTPIENVTVQISNGTYTSSVNSDTNGNFTFGDITYGDYTIDLISDSYRGIPCSVMVNVDEITQVSLVGIPQSIVDDITNGWYSQAELEQAVTDAEAAKNAIIAEKKSDYYRFKLKYSIHVQPGAIGSGSAK